MVKERPRIGAVEYHGNKELQTNKITEELEKEKIDGVIFANTTGDLPLERMYREARYGRIYDGPDEVHRMTVARRLLANPDSAPWRQEARVGD